MDTKMEEAAPVEASSGEIETREPCPAPVSKRAAKARPRPPALRRHVTSTTESLDWGATPPAAKMETVVEDRWVEREGFGLSGRLSPTEMPRLSPGAPASADGEPWSGDILELGEIGTDTGGAQYRRLDIVIDSGAFRSVIPPEAARDYPTEEVPDNEQPKARTATGERVPVLGRKTLSCCFNNGARKSLQFFVMDVMRPLASVSQMVARDCRVVFDGQNGEKSFIHHKPTGDKHKLFLKGGVFILPVWILNSPRSLDGGTPLPEQQLGEVADLTPDFPRQATQP